MTINNLKPVWYTGKYCSYQVMCLFVEKCDNFYKSILHKYVHH